MASGMEALCCWRDDASQLELLLSAPYRLGRMRDSPLKNHSCVFDFYEVCPNQPKIPHWKLIHELMYACVLKNSPMF
jgi:hypothetical protein